MSPQRCHHLLPLSLWLGVALALPPPLHIEVQTWRWTPHSYGVVGQALVLGLARVAAGNVTDAPPWLGDPVPPLVVTVTDMPMYKESWKPTRGLHAPHVEAALDAIQVTPVGCCPDVILRASFPTHVGPPAAAAVGCTPKVYVFGTSEYGTAIPDMLAPGSPPWHQAHPSVTVMPPSRWAAEGFLVSGLPPHQAWVLPHGVDTSVFSPAAPTRRAELRAQYGWGEHDVVVLNVGSMTSNKGVREMGEGVLLAAERLVPPQRLVLVLKGNDALYTSAEFARKFLPPEALAAVPNLDLVYTGELLSTVGIADLMRAADVYLSPYRAEGFNLPVLEATACGLPVIVTAGGPTDEFTRPGFALRVPAPRVPTLFMGFYHGHALLADVPSVADAVHFAATNASWRAAAGPAAATHARRHHSWQRVVDAFLRKVVADVGHHRQDSLQASPAATLWSLTGSTEYRLPPGYTPALAYVAVGDTVELQAVVDVVPGVAPPGGEDGHLLCVAAVKLVAASTPLSSVLRWCGYVPPHTRNATYTIRLFDFPDGCFQVRLEPERPSTVAARFVSPGGGHIVVVRTPARFVVPPAQPRVTVLPATPGARLNVATPTPCASVGATLLNVGAVLDARMVFSSCVVRAGDVNAAAGLALASLTATPPVLGAGPGSHMQRALSTLNALLSYGNAHTALYAALSDPLAATPLAAGKYLSLPSPFWQYTGLDATPAVAAAGKVFGPTVATACEACRDIQSFRVIRVVFVSTSLHNHSVGKVLIGTVLGLASRPGLAVSVVRTAKPGDGTDSVVSAMRLAPGVDLHELPPQPSVAELHAAIRGIDPHVVVYGDVGMDPLTYFAAFGRLAPVQAAFWGSPASTGVPAIDYFVAGEAFVPPTVWAETFTEQVVVLPGLAAVPILPKWDVGAVGATLEGYRLPAGVPLLFCPHTLAKLHPDFDAVIVDVLLRLPTAHLVLLEGHGPAWVGQFLGRLEAAWPPGSDASSRQRVHILPRVSGEEYAALLSASTAVLDAFPYSGFTTSVEALAMSVPVVTLKGNTLRGRQTTALYTVMGILDVGLAVDTPAEYVTTVRRLVDDGAWRATVVKEIKTAIPALWKGSGVVDAWDRFITTSVMCASHV